MTVGIGIIGAGVMGADHARTLNRSVRGAAVTAVADADAARAAAVAAGENARTWPDPLALIGDPRVDAVLVASPDATHEAFVLACLQAGKPVLCEKPLAAGAAACLRIVEAEAGGGRRLLEVGFMRRHDPGYVDLKAALQAGAIGAVLLAHCVHRNRSVPSDFASEMLLTSSAVHEFDVLRWLLGDEIASVSVRAPRPSAGAPAGLRDPQLVLLETASGVLADIELFVSAAYGYDIRCELVGETGTASLAAPRTVEVRRDGVEGAVVPDGFVARFADAYRRELQAWVDGLQAGGPAGPSAWDGYVATAVAEACVASLHSGSPAEVSLAPRPAFYDAAPARD